MSSKPQKFEIIALTLKKFGTAQRVSCLNLSKEQREHYGQYIAFQGYNFIDISTLRPGCSDGNNIHSIYKIIRELRNTQHTGLTSGVNIIQTIAMVGERLARENFWANPSTTLYITFIQLSERANVDYDSFKASLHGIFQNYKDASYALYYSYDFSDFILFAKDINPDNYHSILWKIITLNKQSSEQQRFRQVRDTYTIYAFNSEYLCDAVNSKKKLFADKIDSLDFSLNFSVNYTKSLAKLNTYLCNENINFVLHSMVGRYDLSVAVNGISSEKFWRLLHFVDETYTASPAVFNGYEVMPVVPLTMPDDDSEIQEHCNVFNIQALKILENLLTREYEIAGAYVKETAHALIDLIHNGFSIEFVLAVLPSFVTIAKTLEKLDITSNIDEISRGAHQYFNALNTLTICTMHGERSFVQAPAFSVTYFDIPPRLTAFYHVVVSWITEALNSVQNDNDKDKYQFLIIPDYREGINVECVAEHNDDHVAIISLKEEYFYTPSVAIHLLCHETAHYIGKRFRELRARKIFGMVGFVLLMTTPVATSPKIMSRGKSLFRIIAEVFAEFMVNYYSNQCAQDNNYNKIDNIINFIKDNQYCTKIFNDEIHADNICAKWSLKLASLKDDDMICDIISVLNDIQAKLYHTNYLSVMYDSQDHDSQCYVCEVLAKYLISWIKEIFLNDSDTLSNYMSYMIINIYTYSEAYADLMMFELADKNLSVESYENLLEKNARDWKENFKFSVRHDAVISVIGNEEKFTQLVSFPKDHDPKKIAQYYMDSFNVQSIVEYLKKCQEFSTKSDKVSSAIKIFMKDKPKEQSEFVFSMINQYKDYIAEYLKNFLSE